MFAAIGPSAIQRLSSAMEAGVADKNMVVDARLLEGRQSIKNLSTAEGLRGITVFPLVLLLPDGKSRPGSGASDGAPPLRAGRPRDV